MAEEIPFDDLAQLREETDRIAAASPDEAARKRTILDCQARVKEFGPYAVAALLEMEEAVNERLAAAVDGALAVGCRYGRTVAADDDLGDNERELLQQVSMSGLNLSKDQRVRVLVEALRIEVIS